MFSDAVWEGKRVCMCHGSLKTGLSTENKSREMKESGSLVHVGEIFKMDRRRYYEGHRKGRTTLGACVCVKRVLGRADRASALSSYPHCCGKERQAAGGTASSLIMPALFSNPPS